MKTIATLTAATFFAVACTKQNEGLAPAGSPKSQQCIDDATLALDTVTGCPGLKAVQDYYWECFTTEEHRYWNQAVESWAADNNIQFVPC